jgi:ketosteroid isomerase-like protein
MLKRPAALLCVVIAVLAPFLWHALPDAAAPATVAAPPLPAGASARAESEDAAQIRAVLDMQVAAWNRGDLDAFMTGYWKSDDTLFLGAGGVTRGWQAVLDRYHRAYPDRKAMGRLSFANLDVHVPCADSAFVIGEFHLKREQEGLPGPRQGEPGRSDEPAGVFTLNFRRFPDGWRIVADHTTAYPVAAAPAK